MFQRTKKLISGLLTVVMCAGMIGTAVHAEGMPAQHKIVLSYAGETQLSTPEAGKMDAVKYAELVDAENGIVKITMDIAGTPLTRTEGIDVVVVADESNSMNMFSDVWGTSNVGIVSHCLNPAHWYGLDKEWVAKLYPVVDPESVVIPEEASPEEKAALEAQKVALQEKKAAVDSVLAAVGAWESPLFFRTTDAMRYALTRTWSAENAEDTKAVLSAALNALGDGVDYVTHIAWENLGQVFGSGDKFWSSGANHYVYNETSAAYEKVTLADGAWALPLGGNAVGCYDRLTIEKGAFSSFIQSLLEGNASKQNAAQKNRVAYVGFSTRTAGQVVSFQESYTAIDEHPIWSVTRDPLSLQGAVELMDSNGWTNWAYGLSGALTHIRNRAQDETNRPVYVVFLSDGEANQDGGGNRWTISAEPEVNQTTSGQDLAQLKIALPKAISAVSEGFYAIKYNVDGTAANAYYDLLESSGAQIWNCATADKIGEVLESIKGVISNSYPSGTLSDVIGKDVTLIEGNDSYPITSGYTKTDEEGRVTLTWNFDNVTRESVSFYVQLNENLRTTPGSYLTNGDTEAEGTVVTGANLVYTALSVDPATNALIREEASVPMTSPELTVSETYRVTYRYDESAPENAPAVPVDDTLYAEGETVNVAAAPELENYIFSGWDTSVLEEGNRMPANDVVLIGGWVAAGEYTVEYYTRVDDGEYVKFDSTKLPENAPEGEKVAVNTQITKEYLDGKGLPAELSDGTYTYAYTGMEGVTVAPGAGNVVKVYYDYNTPQPDPVLYDVTVNYLDAQTGAVIAPQYVKSDIEEGTAYDVSDKNAIAIAGYTYSRTEGAALTGSAIDGDKVINVYYTRVVEQKPAENPPADEQPQVDTPVVEIPDESVPQGSQRYNGMTLVEIDDEPIPLSSAPATGDPSAIWVALSVLSGAGLVLTCKKRRDE